MSEETLNSFFELLDRFPHLKRYNGFPVLHEQSVADHITSVCFLSMLIVDYQKTAEGGLQAELVSEVNMEILLRMALLHELDETVCGDVNWVVKNVYGDGALGLVYDKVADEVVDKHVLRSLTVGMQQEYMRLWRAVNAPIEDTFSRERHIVKAADLLDVWLYTRREVALGNKSSMILHAYERTPQSAIRQKFTDYLLVRRLLGVVRVEVST